MKSGIMVRENIDDGALSVALQNLHGERVCKPNTRFSFDLDENDLLSLIKDGITQRLANSSIDEDAYIDRDI
jgi:hypothetical protein